MQVIERCCERATRFQLANEVFLITTLVGLRDDLPSRLFSFGNIRDIEEVRLVIPADVCLQLGGSPQLGKPERQDASHGHV